MLCTKCKILIISLLVLLPIGIRGQVIPLSRWEENAPFQEEYRIDSNMHDQFYIRIRNANFFKNNEYANEFKIGSSLTGLFLEPSLDYYAGSKTLIRAGMHFLKYNGRDNIERAAPILTVQQAINGHINMVFGTIYGTSNHGLKEPVFSFEKYLLDDYENGMQFLFDYPGFIADLWLNWEQFIKEGDPFQEKFTAGLNAGFKLYESKTLTLGIPFQALFRHQGGQIDNTTLPSGTQCNLMQGIKMEWKFEGDFISRVALEHDFFQFIEINPGSHIKIPEGYGNYSLLTCGTRAGELSVGYWTSHDFTSPHGEALFLSNSSYNPDFYMQDREVLSIKYQYHYAINDFLDFVLRIEPYYHFYSNRLDHSFSVMLLVDNDFFLARAVGRSR